MTMLPGALIAEHGVEDGEQLSHNGCERKFLGFAGSEEAPVKGLEYRVVAAANQGGHVEA